MPSTKVRLLEKEHGDLHQVIPDLVNDYGQIKTGLLLGVSSATISRWLRQHGYRLVMKWERIEKGEAS